MTRNQATAAAAGAAMQLGTIAATSIMAISGDWGWYTATAAATTAVAAIAAAGLARGPR